MGRGRYTRDFYIVPTILFHNGDDIYYSLEIAWLKWYIGFSWIRKEEIPIMEYPQVAGFTPIVIAEDKGE